MDSIEGTVVAILDDSVVCEPVNTSTVVRFKIMYDTNTVSFLHSEDGSRYVKTREFGNFEIQNAGEPSTAEKILDNLDDVKSVELDYKDVLDDFERCRSNAKKEGYDTTGESEKIFSVEPNQNLNGELLEIKDGENYNSFL